MKPTETLKQITELIKKSEISMITVRDLCRALDITPPTAKKILTNFEENATLKRVIYGSLGEKKYFYWKINSEKNTDGRSESRMENLSK